MAKSLSCHHPESLLAIQKLFFSRVAKQGSDAERHNTFNFQLETSSFNNCRWWLIRRFPKIHNPVFSFWHIQWEEATKYPTVHFLNTEVSAVVSVTHLQVRMSCHWTHTGNYTVAAKSCLSTSWFKHIRLHLFLKSFSNVGSAKDVFMSERSNWGESCCVPEVQEEVTVHLTGETRWYQPVRKLQEFVC